MTAPVSDDGIDRGVRLFLKLVRRANRGEAMGISYKGFVEHVYGASFAHLHEGRRWLPSDAAYAVRLADWITTAARGRKEVRRGRIAIRAGMDTFIWRKKPPHERPRAAWKNNLPYSQDDWLTVFPPGTRRLVDDS